jgi:NADPH-dependent curcumin reductase
MTQTIQKIVLKHALNHRPTADDFITIAAPAPACQEGGVVAAVLYLSLDPYVGSRLRGRHMGEPAPTPGAGLIPGAIVGRVIQSRTPAAREGDIIHSMEGGWAEQIALNSRHFRVLDSKLAPLSAHLGALGMPGLTAWAGMTQLAQVGPGDIVVVDAAAGPVGGAVGQIARINGAKRVVGIAGGAQKCALVTNTYGFDACVDYKQPDWLATLDASLDAPPSVHFENVGMSILMPVLQRLQPYGRVVLCGLVDQYHADAPPPQIPAGLIVGKRAKLMGLVVYDFYPRFEAFVEEASDWLRSGALTIAEDRVEGLQNAPTLFEKLMRGENIGKALVALAPQ